ncbi:MAG: agmatinase, partial [Proteobacteria bacterium]
HQKNLERYNEECRRVHEMTRSETEKQLSKNRAVITVGGDHSCAEGPIQAYAQKFPNLSILHIDAHADLRVAYEGFTYSHASIMDRVLETTTVKKLVQLGIRDVSPGEVKRTEDDPRIATFFDWDLKDHLQDGGSYKAFAEKVISELTEDVYVSFDIDGLDPKLCPSTGTPVPGGLEFEQATALIRAVVKSGRRIVGADLLEVSPGADDWDGNVGARILYALTLAVYQGIRK